MSYEELEAMVEKALTEPDENGEQSPFSFSIRESDVDHYVLFEGWSPAGEDIVLEETWLKPDYMEIGIADLIVFVENEVFRYDVDEHVEMWVDHRGKDGVPDTVRELVEDAEAIEKMMHDLARRLRSCWRGNLITTMATGASTTARSTR